MRGKTRRIYRWYATLWEVLRQLPGLADMFDSCAEHPANFFSWTATGPVALRDNEIDHSSENRADAGRMRRESR
jgi:hypothetical protein